MTVKYVNEQTNTEEDNGELKPILAHFTETAEEEIKNLLTDMRIMQVVASLQSGEDIPEDLRGHVLGMVALVADIFSVDLPSIDKDPNVTLQLVSREINLSRLLRERGLFRLYRLLRVQEDGVPLFMTRINPNTGSPFAKQEEFVGWFCQEAHVARGLVFQRLATIDRLLSLGMTLEDAFATVLTKPYAIRETMNMVVTKFGKTGDIETVNPDVISQVANRIMPGEAKGIRALADKAIEDPDEYMEEFVEASKPVVQALVKEVAQSDRAKDAMEFVKHDLLKRPEIVYRWDMESEMLLVELTRKDVDENGNEHIAEIITIPFVPDTLDLPIEIKHDLLRRLPIHNRLQILDNE